MTWNMRMMMDFDDKYYINPAIFATTIFIVAVSYYFYIVRTGGSTKTKCDTMTMPPLFKEGMHQTIQMMVSTESPWLLLKAAKEVGASTFRLRLPILGIPMIAVVGDFDLAREILTDSLSTKTEFFYKAFDGVTGGKRSVFTTNGDFWHSRRKGLAPAFSTRHVKRMNVVALEKTDEWIQTRLVRLVEKGEPFDVGQEMIGVILDSISKTAFEYDLSQDEKEMFLHELHLSLREFMLVSNPFRKMFGIFLSERQRAFLAGRRLQALALKIIQSYRAMESPISGTIIDQIMNNDAYENDEERAADIIVLLVGGHDTTAYSIAWILLLLAKHPEHQQSLRDSLSSTSPDQWSQSSVLRNIVKEGIRMYPVAAGGSGRTLGRDFKSQEGYVLPKGSAVIVPFMSLFRNETVFSNADTFEPSRWEHPTDDMNKSFIPFAIGKQNCVGQSLANAELNCIIPRIISEYELEVVDEGIAQYCLTLKPIKTLLRAEKI